MTTVKVNGTEETQKEFNNRLKYILNNNKLTAREDRVKEVRKMFELNGYRIPIQLFRKLRTAKLITK